MKIQIYHIDAFTNELFKGNPAGVCLLDDWLEDSVLQSIATENNLPETAFVVQSNNSFEIKWFTPKCEIDLCGHATLASAFVLYETNKINETETIIFSSKSGELKVSKSQDILWLDFPSRKPHTSMRPFELIEALGKSPTDILKSRDYLAIYNSEEEILNLEPNFDLLRKIKTTGIIVTAKGNNSDFVSRFFAPSVGIDEDPVTGSAHATLIPYWAEKLGKDKLHAFQLSKRGGELFCENKNDRVLIGGRAVKYFEGIIEI